MAHRRAQSAAMLPPTDDDDFSSPTSQAVSASGVAAVIAAAAATALAPVTSALPTPRSSGSLDVDDFLVQTAPGTPSKPGMLFPRSAPPSISASSLLSSTRALLRRLAAPLPLAHRPCAPPLPLKSPHLTSTSMGRHRAPAPKPSYTPHLPLRRPATCLALIALLVLSAWTVLTTSFAERESGHGHASARAALNNYSDGARKGWKDWRKKRPAQKLIMLNPEERLRLLSSASFRGANVLPTSADQRHVRPHSSNANPHAASNSEHGPITLAPREELAALTAFMAALPWNALPAHVDGLAPLDPELVLDFDVRRDHAKAMVELETMRREVWAINPVVVFGKSRHAPTRHLRAILDNMHLTPAPTVFEIDTRVDEPIVSVLLARLTSPSPSPSSDSSDPLKGFSLPILLVGGEPVDMSDPDAGAGSPREHDTMETLVESGELRRMVTAAGAVPGEGKKKKGKK